jgi:uncharacterized protein (TIGR00369 family)
MLLRAGFDVAHFNRFGRETFPGFVGLVITEVSAFADTLAGYGCVAHLPQGAQNFTTVELKTNFLGTATQGRLYGEARAVHLGRTTQVWDATVVHGEERRKLALFRCTQLILYPK